MAQGCPPGWECANSESESPKKFQLKLFRTLLPVTVVNLPVQAGDSELPPEGRTVSKWQSAKSFSVLRFARQCRPPGPHCQALRAGPHWQVVHRLAIGALSDVLYGVCDGGAWALQCGNAKTDSEACLRMGGHGALTSNFEEPRVNSGVGSRVEPGRCPTPEATYPPGLPTPPSRPPHPGAPSLLQSGRRRRPAPWCGVRKTMRQIPRRVPK